MKGREFAEFLTDFEGIVRATGSPELADALNALGRVFSSAPSSDVGDICSVLSGVHPPEHCNGPRTREMLSLFLSLRRLLKSAKADKTTVEDVDRFAEALRVHDQASPDDLADAAIKRLRDQVSAKAPATGRPSTSQQDDLIKYYLAQLADALGDDNKFRTSLDELKNDARINRVAALTLAKEFAKETARSRDHALKLILRRHTAVLGSRARQKANKGRTAA